jgi:hexosaminidase
MPLPFRFAAPLLLSAALAAAQTAPLHLIPQPRSVTPHGDVSLASGVQVVCPGCDAEDTFAATDLQQTLAERGVSIASGTGLRITLQRLDTHPDAAFTAAMKPEGYTIASSSAGVTITGATAAGLFYGAQTVKQLIQKGAPGSAAAGSFVLQSADIRDYPAMQYRGLHDDLSRGPIDTLDFQKKLIRTLAAYKVNVYSPYFESTQAYASNPLAAIPGASLTPADARELAAYAAKYHITIIPEQEAFGHLSHMLTFEQYAGAAETPHGDVLAPGQPQSIALIDNMFKDLAAEYPGPFLHVGGDETFGLGMGRTRAAVDQRGLASVYLDFMQKIVTDLQPLHRKILFWGDIAQSAPALLKAMPQSFKSQTIVVAWGYSPQPQGFAAYLKPYADAGFELWVSPSINNYRQIWPNQREALEDIQEFTRDGQKFGATGQLNTLWNDDGESLANENWYGILFGAAAAWQPGQSSIDDYKAAYGPVFHGDQSGLINQAEDEMTAAMALLHDNKVVSGIEGTDGLFWIDPWSKDGQMYAAKMRPIDSALRLHAEQAIVLLDRARSTNPSLREDGALSAMDFAARRLDFLGLIEQLSDEMIHSFAQAQATYSSGEWRKAKPGVASLLGDINGVNGRLEDLTYGLSSLRDMYQQQWLATYRPANLRPVLDRYDFTVALWLARIDKMRSIQHQWYTTHTLDPEAATALGIPAPATPVAPSPQNIAPEP